MPTRREFLASTAIPAIAATSRLKADDKQTLIIDTHLHCFAGKDDARFPYHKDGPYAPDEPASPEHLLTCMTEAGVDHAIVVHPEPYQDDHRYLEHCLTVGKGKLKGTCLYFADRPETFPQMKELVKRFPIVSLRIHAYNPDHLPPFGKPELKTIWTTASDAGLAIQLHFEPRHAEGFEPLIRDFPKTQVYIDHLGRPFQGSRLEHAVVMRWAKYDNVVMKLSAVPNRNSYPHRNPQAVIKQLTAAYGADRLMYGGGFGAATTGKSYRKERERIAGFLAHMSESERTKIFGGVATKTFGFG